MKIRFFAGCLRAVGVLALIMATTQPVGDNFYPIVLFGVLMLGVDAT